MIGWKLQRGSSVKAFEMGPTILRNLSKMAAT